MKTVKTVLRAKPIPVGATEVYGIFVYTDRGGHEISYGDVPIALSGGTLVVELDTEKGEARLIHVCKREG